MRGLIYNIRGFGQEGRRNQLKRYIRQEKLDIIGLQETIKPDFSMTELRSLEFGGQFAWNWLPANGLSGGLLLGFRDDCFEVGEWKKGIFFLSTTFLQRKCRTKWCFILVYGPADHRRSVEFLGELETVVRNCNLPLVVGATLTLFVCGGQK